MLDRNIQKSMMLHLGTTAADAWSPGNAMKASGPLPVNNYWGRIHLFLRAHAGRPISAGENSENFVRHQQQTKTIHYWDVSQPHYQRRVIYNTADGTWWFVRAAYEYLLLSGDQDLLFYFAGNKTSHRRCSKI
jgi:hypothetical protein